MVTAMTRGLLYSGHPSTSLLLGLVFRITAHNLARQNRFDELQEGVISYGPCQFPTLGFIVDRYKRIQASYICTRLLVVAGGEMVTRCLVSESSVGGRVEVCLVKRVLFQRICRWDVGLAVDRPIDSGSTWMFLMFLPTKLLLLSSVESGRTFRLLQ